MFLPSAVIASALAGTTIRVPEDEPTLASALNAANPDDTIQLAAGTFDIPSGRDIDIPLLGAGLTTILTRTTGTAVIEATDHDVVIRNLVIDGEGRPAVRCEEHDATLVDVVLTNGGPPTAAPGGGLLHAEECALSLERVTFDASAPARFTAPVMTTRRPSMQAR